MTDNKTKIIRQSIFSALILFLFILFVHISLGYYNRQKCLNKVKECDNELLRYRYSGGYLGNCVCEVTCAP